MTEHGSDATASLDLLIYILFLLAAVFLGPLKAVVGLVLYWLMRPEKSGSDVSD